MLHLGIKLCMVSRKHWLASHQQHLGIMWVMAGSEHGLAPKWHLASKMDIMLCMVGRKQWLASSKLHLGVTWLYMHVMVRLIHIILPMHMRYILLCR